MRLDLYLSEKFGYSRTKAAGMIADGFVCVSGKTVTKASYGVKDSDEVVVTKEYRFASRGGDKLEKAFSDFSLDVDGRICADIGASNGGFTDCLLSHGAAKVYAVDVGACAFDDALKNDPRVVVMDNTNARDLNENSFGELCAFACIDVSFISLKLVLPAVLSTVEKGGEIVALIKPQFEAGKKNLTKTGLVLSEKVRKSVVDDIVSFAQNIGTKFIGLTTAPLREGKNVEYLIRLKKL